MPHASFLLRSILYVISGAFALVTISGNAMFALGLGTSVPEKIVCVLMSVSADAFKCMAVIVCLRLLLQRRFVLAGASCILGLLCLGWSMLSGTGFALSVRETTHAMHAAVIEQQQAWVTVIRRADEKLQTVHARRPVEVIRAELASEMVPTAIWRRTRECLELTVPESRDACAKMVELRRELAAAESARALEEQIVNARRQLTTGTVVGINGEAQVAGLAKLAGMDEPTLRQMLAVFLALLIEAGSAVGFAVAHAATSSPPLAQSGKTPQPTPSTRPLDASNVIGLAARHQARGKRDQPTSKPTPSLDRWAQECVRREPEAAVAARVAYRTYATWATSTGVTPVSETAFGRYLSSNIRVMGGAKVARNRGSFYVGIRITSAQDMHAARVAA